MSHEEKKIEESDNKDWWKTYTCTGVKNGQFVLVPNRDPALGIDPIVQQIADFKEVEAELVTLKAKSLDAIEAQAKLETEVTRLKDLVQQRDIDLQSANAKVDNLDRAVHSEREKALAKQGSEHRDAISKLQSAHKTEFESQKTTLEQLVLDANARAESHLKSANELAEETANLRKQLGERKQEIDALETKVTTLGFELKAMTDARDDAKRTTKEAAQQVEQARRETATAQESTRMAEEVAKETGKKLQQLTADLQRLDPGNINARVHVLEQQLGWYKSQHGAIPADVEKKILAGLEVVPKEPQAPTTAAAEPDKPAEAPDVSQSDMAFFASLPDAPVDDDEESDIQVVEDDIEDEIGSDADDDVDDDGPFACDADSITGCDKIATWWTSTKFVRKDGKGAFRVHACEDHYEDCGVFIEHLHAYFESTPADADALRCSMIPLRPFTPTTTNPQENAHELA